MQPSCYVGIDVGKFELVVAIRPAGTTFTVPNTRQGYRQLLEQLGPGPRAIVMEATGRYHRALQQALADAGSPAAVVDPARIHGFRISEGIKAKTDGLDADLIARFAEQKQPAPTPLPDPVRTALTEWVRSRDFLVSHKQAFANRLAEMPVALQPSHRTIMAALQAQIDVANAEIRQLLTANDVVTDQTRLLTSVPGLGTVTAAALLALLPELGTVSTKAIASLAGLAPRDHQSGSTDKRKHLRGGRGRLRQALYMMALSATRHDPIIRVHYQQLRARGKAAKVALLACARRMLGILNAMVRERLTWQETAVGKGTFLPTPP